MKWIEVIQLRSSAQELPKLAEKLRRFVSSELSDEVVSVYRHEGVMTDLSVHLVHQTAENSRPDTTLGQHLAAQLEEHGLIDRSLWVEVTEKGGKSNA